MNSGNDKLVGTYNSSVGKVKEVTGFAINDKELENQGLLQKTQGKAQQLKSEISDNIKKGTHALGDTIEKIGNNLQEKGFHKIGNGIKSAGDKIEHIAD